MFAWSLVHTDLQNNDFIRTTQRRRLIFLTQCHYACVVILILLYYGMLFMLATQNQHHKSWTWFCFTSECWLHKQGMHVPLTNSPTFSSNFQPSRVNPYATNLFQHNGTIVYTVCIKNNLCDCILLYSFCPAWNGSLLCETWKTG